MKQNPIPEEIDRIFDKPGSEWTSEEPEKPEEREKVKAWLLENEQEKRLLFVTLRYLGAGTSYEDAEDTFMEFFAEHLDEVIDSYDPEKGRRFWNYLWLCLRNFSLAEGKKIRRRGDREPPLLSPRTADDGDHFEYAIKDPGPNPEEKMLQEEERKKFEWDISILQKCIQELKLEVILMHYFEEKSVAQIAEELKISEVNVRVRLHRSRGMLKRCILKHLQEKGESL